MEKNNKIFFDKVAIIGVGLIGGSLAIEMRERGMAGGITGIGRGQENLDKAMKLGLVDSATRSVAEGVKDADLVVVAVPVKKTIDVINEALPNLKSGAVVTDVGSVKKELVDIIDPLFDDVASEGLSFVGGHPIAGTEESGAEAAFAGLYKGRKTILTPSETTPKVSLEKIRLMWEETGSEVIEMEAGLHDRILAAVSHLPHVIAYTLVNTVANFGEGDILKFSAGGFKDFTRIAGSSPEMWSDICALNSEAIIKIIDDFQERLTEIKAMIEGGNMDALTNEFESAKRVRDSLNDDNEE